MANATQRDLERRRVEGMEIDGAGAEGSSNEERTLMFQSMVSMGH